MLDFKDTRLKTEDHLNYEGLDISFEEIEEDILYFKQLSSDLSIAVEQYGIFTNPDRFKLNIESIKDNIMYTCSKLDLSYNYYISPLKTESEMLKVEAFKEFASRLLGWIKDLWGKINEFFKKSWMKVQAAYYKLTAEMFELRKMVYKLRNKSPIKFPKKDILKFVDDFSAYLCAPEVNGHPDKVFGMLIATMIVFLDEKEIHNRMDLLRGYTKLLKTLDIKRESEPGEKEYDTYLESIENLFKSTYKSCIEMIGNQDLKSISEDDNQVSYPIVASIRPHKGVKGFKVIYLDKYVKIKDQSDIDFKYVAEIDKGLKESNDLVDISFMVFTKMAEAIDECKYFINNITKEVFDLDKEINLCYDTLNGSENILHKRVTHDIFIITRSMCSDFVMSILDHIKLVNKWVKRVEKEAKKSTNLGVIDFYNKVRNSKSGEVIIYKIPVNNPNELKLYDYGEICFIDPGKQFWKDMKRKNLYSPGVALSSNIPNSLSGVKEDSPDYEKINQYLSAQDVVVKGSTAMNDAAAKMMSGNDPVGYYLQNRVGLIFLDIEELSNPKSVIAPLVSLTNNHNFIYFHELGHLLTGQQENLLKLNNPDNITAEDLEDGFIRYAYEPAESRADAFACVKCGVSPKTVSDRRLLICLNMEFDIKENTIENALKALESGLSQQTYKRLEEKYLKIRDDMENNITRELSKMKEYADLTPYEVVRNKLLSIN